MSSGKRALPARESFGGLSELVSDLGLDWAGFDENGAVILDRQFEEKLAQVKAGDVKPVFTTLWGKRATTQTAAQFR